MASPDQRDFSLSSPDHNFNFLDLVGRQVEPENVVICDNFDIYDFKQVTFSPFGDMLYRGRLLSRKESFTQLPHQLQAIYHRDYAPKPQGDFSTYRSTDGSSSSSSNQSTCLPQQHIANDGSDHIISDGTDAAGLLAVPLNIDVRVPLSQAYKQYEPRGFKLATDTIASKSSLGGLSNYSSLAATLSRKRKQIGFSREEVIMYGGLTCTPCRPSNLSDPLFTTLFRQENFYDTTQDVYDVITPALKLAEKFITDPTQVGYWCTLAFGNRVIDLKLTAATGICHERLVRGVPVTDEIYAQTLNLLNRMGKLVEYRFDMHDDPTDMICFGRTLRPDRGWNLAPQYHDRLSQGHTWPAGQPFPLARQYPKDPWDDSQVVYLHPDFYTAAKRFSATKNQELASRLRFNFWFAVNIVHELAHVFEAKSSQANFDKMASTCTSLEDFKQIVDPRLALGTSEAYWGSSSWAEAGGRWEWETFGGRVQPINGKIDASRGMAISNADGFANVATAFTSDIPIGICVQMGFMEEVQQQSFWARPQHTLKFPLSGAKAYVSNDMHLFDINTHLRQREENHVVSIDPVADPVTDPADIKLGQLLTASMAHNDSDDADKRPSKRRRVDDISSVITEAPGTRAFKKLNKRGRLRQPLIRRYMNKGDADAKAIREEAMAHVALDEVQQARETAGEAVSFRELASGQRRMHDFFAYPGEDRQDEGLSEGYAEEPYVDPATKRLDDLTLNDKWKLAEEFVCLAMVWEPIEFQSQRVDHPSWRPVAPFNPDDPNGFTQQALDMLMTARANNPGGSWPERRAAEKAQYDQKRDMAQRIADMDELVTYLGFSRIECHRTFKDTGKFPMGMSVLNFHAYKPMLDAFRLTQKIQNTGEYISAVTRGEVSAGATGVSLINEDNKLNPPPVPTQTIKITDYFKKSRPKDARSSSASTARSHTDPVGFPPLSKVPTPEELTRKYQAWVAAGADMRSRPEGLHASQLLSASLGGSLQTIMPDDLAKVVAERERKLEADRAEQKRRDAKAKADAADKLSRKDRKTDGSSSRESEL